MDIEKLIEQAGIKPVVREPEQPQEPVAPVDPTPVEPTPPPEPTIDRFQILSESLGREIKSDDDLTTFKSSLTDYEVKLKDYQEKQSAWEKEREELSKAINPMDYFASPELFTLNGLLKKFPDKNPMALTEISIKDFSKTYLESPAEVLALDLMLENPGIYTSKADAMEDVFAKYAIEDPEDIDSKILRRMKVDAKEKADKFDGIRKQIEIPKPVDLSAEKAKKSEAENERIRKMTEATEPLFTKAIPDSLKEIDFPVILKGEDGEEVSKIGFKYEIGESFKSSKAVKEVLEAVRRNTIQEGTEWTKEKESQLQSEITDLLKANYLWKNREKVFAAIKEDLFAKFRDEAWMKRHNPRPLKQNGQPATKADPKDLANDEKRAKFLKDHNIKI